MEKVRIGKIMITTIATVSMVTNVVLLLFHFLFLDFVSIVQTLVRIAFTVALICGVRWVRYLYAVGAALGAVFAFFFLIATNISSPLLNVYYGFMIPYSIVASVLLFGSKCITAYFYEKKHGIPYEEDFDD